MEFYLITTFACIAGSTAPDWLELPIKDKQGRIIRLIAHRTITHNVAIWLTLTTWAYSQITGFDLFPVMPTCDDPILLSIAWGFGFGGLVHLFWDFPNKKPIPIFMMKAGVSLHLWESGKHERPISLVTALITGLVVYRFDLVEFV
ncbi:hypothetical protein JCM19235_1315 [Vibrio maritimus]|uniref:Membrane-bound metal-dependent hydrolase n=1 Tax=Vibrio maritimus TaxID=990268 RepID=A0A090S945_9VIBR|nr:hypothetical protein JCM19235_1315 [Vibrio maritimus]